MLTRIEIDGFKSFENFGVDLQPFTAIVGPNGSGKSNLFDAIRLLARLAEDPIAKALQGARGDANDLYRSYDPNSKSLKIRLAAEVLVSPVARDAWGGERNLNHTRIRYEIDIARAMEPRGYRHMVTHEKAFPIQRMEDDLRLAGLSKSERLENLFFLYAENEPWIETNQGHHRLEYDIRGADDSRRSGNVPEERIEASLLSSVTSAKDFPHLVALREELRSWKMIHLDPETLRSPCSMAAPPILEPDGANLPRVLWEIKAQSSSEQRQYGVLSDMWADLSSMVPGVVRFDVEELQREGKLLLTVLTRDGIEFPSTVVSEGTLRLIALLTTLNDPRHGGLLSIEELENGIHPARLPTLVEIIRDAVTDFRREEIHDGDPLSQVLVSTHSPTVLSALDDNEILYAEMVGIADPERKGSCRATRMRRVWPKDKGKLPSDKKGLYATQFDISRYLTTAAGEV